ncbi:DUF2855 family protein [Pseudomonas aeruginosa]|nr:DUF2855 family protein [Pseudomonas aeruginosa]
MPCATGSSSRPARGWASSRSGASPRCLLRAARGRTGRALLWLLSDGQPLLVAPAQVRGSGFVDASEHRRDLPSVYNQYLRCSSDPLYRASDEALQMLLRPLFTTRSARRLPRRACLLRRHRPAAEQCLEQDRHRPGLRPPAQSCATRPGLPHRRPDLRGQPRLRRRPGLL